MNPNFIKPHYDLRGFASLPQQISRHISSGKYDTVVLFLIDGFGWRFFEKFQEKAFLQQTTRLGSLTKLTSQFPSTTAAHLTTIHTGMPVGEHGVFEWYYYEPALDNVIAPLLYSFAGTSQRDTLKSGGVKAALLYPTNNIYRSFKAEGVSATLFQHREYTPSTYSDILFKGAKTIGYRTLPEGLVNLADRLAAAHPPAYFFFYFDRIDAIGHEYGPGSPQIMAEIEIFLATMEQVLLKSLQGNHKKILFLLTADHGQVETDPAIAIYINTDKAFAGVEKFIRKNRNGIPIVPAGSARDFFLYINTDMLDEALSFLSTRLEGRAEVRKCADLISEGYFGPVISAQFRARLADLVILPYRGESVWWFEKNKFEQKFRGHHGGMTALELEIPLLAWEM